MNEHQPIAESLVKFVLNDKEVSAHPGETIWQVANQHGVNIPHLCYRNDQSYKADGNCRACMVQIEGERTLAASCQREVSNGLIVNTNSQRVKKSQKLVFYWFFFVFSATGYFLFWPYCTYCLLVRDIQITSLSSRL